MKILIFSAFDGVPYTGEEPMRYAAISEQFLKNGHEVIYVSSDFSHMHKKKRVLSNYPANLKMILLPTQPYASNFSITRIKSHYKLSGSLHSWLGTLNTNQMPNLVIGASPPIFANNVLLHFCHKHNIPFIYDIQDLWPEEFVRFLPGKQAMKFLLQPYFSTAAHLVKKASGVTAVSKDYLEYYQKQIGAKPHQVFYLGTDVEKYRDVELNLPTPKKAFKIIMLGNSQAGNFVLDAARAIQSIPEASLVIAGLKEKTLAYQKQLADEKLERVEIMPWLDKEEMYKVLPGFAAGLILVNPETKSAFPNRAFSYFAAGLPVISNIRGGELETLIEMKNLGQSITLDGDTLKTAIRHCIAQYPAEEHQRIQEFARMEFSKNDIYQEYYHWAITNFGN